MGWKRLADGTADGVSLIAQVKTRWTEYTVPYPRQKLANGAWDELWLESLSDSELRDLLRDVEITLLQPSPLSDGTLELHSTADAWVARDEFLRIPIKVEAVLDFLKRWGLWDAGEYVDLGDLVRLQAAIHTALTHSPAEWFSRDYSRLLNLRRNPSAPFLSMVTDKLEAAMRMTVSLDLLNEFKFKACLRSDCRQPFKVESKHKRKYCSRICSHLEAVRRSRTTPSGT